MSSKESSQTLDVTLERNTVTRLRKRAETYDALTFDDVVSKILDETKTSITLQEFIDRIVTNDDVAQIDVYKESIDSLEVHVYSDSELDEDLFAGVDSVEFNGELHRFEIGVSASEPLNRGWVTVFTDERIPGVTAESVEEVPENLGDWLVERQLKIEQDA